jgi:2-polyprenyl-3-methyl-5-hydroxy-6-metoxy-1,4-benzoquinol methylase
MPNNRKELIEKSIELAELEFQKAPMDHYYSHPVVGFFSRLRVQHIIKSIPDIKGKKILDVGCEAGYVSISLAKMGADVVSFDVCLDALKAFRKKNSGESGYKIFQALAQDVSLKSEIFDVVVCTEVIEHTPYPEMVLSEINRVLKNNGILIITIPNEGLRRKVYGIVKLFGINTDIEKEVTLFEYDKKFIETLCKKYFKLDSVRSFPFFFPITRFLICKKA